MDSPNRITNKKIGTQVVTGMVSGNPSSRAPQPCWTTPTRTPWAAEIDSRFISAALTATVTDRNTAVSSTIDTATTIATSHGSPRPVALANATFAALGPVT